MADASTVGAACGSAPNLGRDGEAKGSSASCCQSIDLRAKSGGGSDDDHGSAASSGVARSRLQVLSRDAPYLNNVASAMIFAEWSVAIDPDSTDSSELWENRCGKVRTMICAASWGLGLISRKQLSRSRPLLTGLPPRRPKIQPEAPKRPAQTVSLEACPRAKVGIEVGAIQLQAERAARRGRSKL